VVIPENISTTFLGFLNLTSKSWPLAVLAAISTFFQFKVTASGQVSPKGDTFADNLTRSMQTQMKYFFPVIVFFISYQISGVIALYWLTSNLVSIAQEIFIRRKLIKVSV
jgi:membrane protein insertase Oxa1/YidC/SpoIIIJ